MNTNFLSYLSCIGKLEEKRREVNEFCRFFFNFAVLYCINFPYISKFDGILIHSILLFFCFGKSGPSSTARFSLFPENYENNFSVILIVEVKNDLEFMRNGKKRISLIPVSISPFFLF